MKGKVSKGAESSCRKRFDCDYKPQSESEHSGPSTRLSHGYENIVHEKSNIILLVPKTNLTCTVNGQQRKRSPNADTDITANMRYLSFRSMTVETDFVQTDVEFKERLPARAVLWLH